jgi:hypothetical protein
MTVYELRSLDRKWSNEIEISKELFSLFPDNKIKFKCSMFTNSKVCNIIQR